MKNIYMPKKVEQINDYLFIDAYKSNQIKVGETKLEPKLLGCVR